MITVPAPTMVTISLAMVATAVFKLVKAKALVLFDFGGISLNFASPIVLVAGTTKFVINVGDI
jgi:hypothetical protein